MWGGRRSERYYVRTQLVQSEPGSCGRGGNNFPWQAVSLSALTSFGLIEIPEDKDNHLNKTGL